MRSGEFSLAILDPGMGSPFSGNAIPASRIAPQSTALLKFYPPRESPESAGLQLPGSAGEHYGIRTMGKGARTGMLTGRTL